MKKVDVSLMNPGEWLAVMGAGELGLNAVAIAKAMGFEKVVSCDLDPTKLQTAVSMGADAVLDTSREDALEELRKITGNQLLGAPNLTNDIWLYGSSPDDIRYTLLNGRNGIMPGHSELIGPDRGRILTAYVYSLSQ